MTGPRDSDNHIAARVRITCDDDDYSVQPNTAERWQLVPNIDGDETPNSQAEFRVDQEFFDQYNWMIRAPVTTGCKRLDDDGNKIILASTYVYTLGTILGRQAAGEFEYHNKRIPVHINPDRKTTTVCRIRNMTQPFANDDCKLTNSSRSVILLWEKSIRVSKTWSSVHIL